MWNNAKNLLKKFGNVLNINFCALPSFTFKLTVRKLVIANLRIWCIYKTFWNQLRLEAKSGFSFLYFQCFYSSSAIAWEVFKNIGRCYQSWLQSVGIENFKNLVEYWTSPLTKSTHSSLAYSWKHDKTIKTYQIIFSIKENFKCVFASDLDSVL